MEQTGSHFISLFGVVSVLCILIAAIMLINLIQRAFERTGVIWGIITVIFPVGTYLYCRRNWDAYGRNFTLISGLTLIGLVLWLVVRYI